MKLTRQQLESYRDRTVEDLIGPNCRLLFVGIKPGLWTAAVGAHFARRGNRFYPALFRAGITDRAIDGSSGMREQDRDHLLARGVGITNLVARATARADELDAAELRAGVHALRDLVAGSSIRVIAVAGITAYRVAFDAPKAQVGEEPERFEGARVWVVPNPSGLNAHETVDSLADAYRRAAVAAGLSLDPGAAASSARNVDDDRAEVTRFAHER